MKIWKYTTFKILRYSFFYFDRALEIYYVRPIFLYMQCMKRFLNRIKISSTSVLNTQSGYLKNANFFIY